jgi:phage gp36-like protein
MTYATRADFLNQLKDDETTGLLSPDRVESLVQAADVDIWLEKASSEIDQYIGGRYSRAIAVGCSYLVYACVVIARKQSDLYLERDKVIRDYDDVMIWLKSIRDQKGDLIGIDGALAERPKAGRAGFGMAIGCI